MIKQNFKLMIGLRFNQIKIKICGVVYINVRGK